MFTNMSDSGVKIAVAFLPFIMLTAVSSAFEPDDVNVEDFDVKPGGMVQEHISQWEGVECKFIYACQGGTNEQWAFSIHRNKDKTEYSCTVERPSGTSYLFFQQFEMQVKNLKISEAYAESQSGRTLSSEEYTIDVFKNTVSHVEGKFNSQLAKLAVLGSKGREEL